MLQLVLNSASFVIRLALHLFTPPLGIFSFCSGLFNVASEERSMMGGVSNLRPCLQVAVVWKASWLCRNLCNGWDARHASIRRVVPVVAIIAMMSVLTFTLGGN